MIDRDELKNRIGDWIGRVAANGAMSGAAVDALCREVDDLKDEVLDAALTRFGAHTELLEAGPVRMAGEHRAVDQAIALLRDAGSGYRPKIPPQPEPQFIVDLRHELQRSKMTHNFTLSRDELGLLMKAWPWYPPRSEGE